MDAELLRNATLMTVELTLFGSFFGAVVGMLVLAGRRCPIRAVAAVVIAWVEIVRGVPPLVWLMLIFLGVGGLAPSMAANLALGFIAAAYFSEIYRSGLEAVPRGQLEAVDSLGIARVKGYLRVVLPQAARVALPAMFSYAIGLVKDTSLASVIGVAELTFVANRAANRTGDGITPFLIVGGIYLAISIALGLAGRGVARRAGKSWVRA